VTVAVVGSALIRVAENLVGLAAGLELLLRIRVIRIAVGVVLHGEPAIRSLQLRVARRALHL